MKIPYKNRSPYGWWIATYLEMAIWDGEKLKLNKRYLTWENTIVLKARERNAAYTKAVKLAENKSKFEDPKSGRSGHWEFLGLTSLLPIHEKLQDGAEILWIEHTRRPLKSLKGKVRQKKQLEAFLDD